MSDMGAVLDVAIGLTFMYMMTSLLVTIVQEGLATMMQLRAKNLFEAIENMVTDPTLKKHPDYKDLVVDLYRHPLMQSLYRQTPLAQSASAANFVRQVSLPSYVPSRIFTIALLDVLRGKDATEALGINQVLAGAGATVSKLPDGQLKRTLTLFVADGQSLGANANHRAHMVSERIEGWFNDSMSRASGWYKRTAQRMSLGIGLALTLLINANTFNVAGQLWSDNALRAQVTATATAYYKDQSDAKANPAPIAGAKEGGENGSVAGQWNDQMKRLKESSLPIGWPSDFVSALPHTLAGWAALIFGWLVTAVAASLGATFWFDVLGKALQIRGSGPRIAEDATRKPVAVAATVAVESPDDATSGTVAAAASSRG